MKEIKNFIFVLAAAFVLSSCGGSKQTIAPSNLPARTKIAKDECQLLQEKRPEIRAWGEGISYSLSSASNAAELQARAKFARALNAKVKAIEGSQNFDYNKSSTNGREGATVRDEGANRNGMQLSDAEEVIRNAVIINTSQFMLQDGSYQVFVCLEYKEGVAKMAEDITEKVKQRVSDEDRIKMQYEFQKFRELIEKELKTMNTDEQSM